MKQYSGISKKTLIYPSFPRKRESMLLNPLDSRFRGNDDCGINQSFPKNNGRSAIYCANDTGTGSRSKLRSYILSIALCLTVTTPVGAAESMQLEGATITGNQELPKALHIVPWKPSSAGDLSGRPMNSLIDEAPEPIDRDVFLREMDYYDAVHSIE